MNGSLQFRLAWRLALVFSVVILATSFAILLHRGSGNTDIPRDELTEAIDQVRAGLSLGSDGKPRLDLPANPGFSYAVDASDGRSLFASDKPPPAVPSSWSVGFLRKDDETIGLREVESAIGRVAIRVGMDVRGAQGWLAVLGRELDEELLPVLLPTLLAGLIIGALTLRDGLRPLQRLARAAGGITPAVSERRLPLDGLPRELAPLVRAINAALDRLDQGFRAQRDFTADAAHQLRTPLAILAAHLDTLDDRTVAASLREDVARMSRLVDQLLQVAELEALTVQPTEQTDLSALALEVAEAMAPVALARKRDIAVAGASLPVHVHGNHDSLHQALRNLVENALSHTGEGTTVEISIHSQPPSLAVSDQGPGIPAADRDKLFERFWRADRSGTRGAGLGLAIVQRITAAHGARIEVADATGGGAKFTILFAG
jgi:signal transduction histidine kinase